METRQPHRERILLAEDDAAMRELLAAALRFEGYHVVPARNGIEALERLGSATLGHRHYDAIVSDIRMPGPSGLDMLSGLRAAGLKMPIVLITAFGSDHTIVRAMHLGASAVLNKPFLLETLVGVLEDVLRASDQTEARCHACGAPATLCSADRHGRFAWCPDCWELATRSPDDLELGVGD